MLDTETPPIVTGPLWPDAYACVWPRGVMPGPYRCGCNASYGQSCRLCDGTLDDEREAAKMRRAAARSAR